MSKTKLSLILGLLLSGSALMAQASLISTDGGLGVYDSVDNITWTSDANLLGTLEAHNSSLIATIVSDEASAIGVAYSYTLTSGDFGFGGQVDWYGAQAYVDYLNKINYGNSNQWVLPSAGSSPATGYYQTGSQLGELFYTELEGQAGSAIPINSLFTNEVRSSAYSSGTVYAPNPINVWEFNTYNGTQGVLNKGSLIYAWAVSPGQVTAAATTVPEPGIISLMIAGLLGLIVKRVASLGVTAIKLPAL